MPRNLYLRGRTYTARYVVPVKYRKLIGKSTLAQSTGTGDLREAERRSHRILAELHERVMRLAARSHENPRDPNSVLNAAHDLRKEVEAGRLKPDDALALLAERLTTHLEIDRTIRRRDGNGLLRSYVKQTPEEAAYWRALSNNEQPEENLAEPAGDENAQTTYRAAFDALKDGGGLLLGRAADDFEANQIARGVRPTTAKSQARAVRLFRDHIGERAVNAVTRKDASGWTTGYVLPLKRAHKTKTDLVTALVVFFSYLELLGHVAVGDNPFTGLTRLLRPAKRGTEIPKEKPHRPWTDAELKKLGTLPDDDTFRCVGLLALYSGARTDEVCSLRVADVDLDALAFTVRAGKTEAALRVLPLHSAIVPAVERMVARAEDASREFLFPLKPDAEGKRDGALRAYRRMDRLFGEDRPDRRTDPNSKVIFDFYGLRHTAGTALERAGVDATLRGRIMGHTPEDLASSTYSAGAELEQMRAAIERLRFPIV
jgi:integrase